MGWGEKAIEVRSLETGLLDGVFTHKRAQQFRFLCERNEKVRTVYEHLQHIHSFSRDFASSVERVIFPESSNLATNLP